MNRSLPASLPTKKVIIHSTRTKPWPTKISLVTRAAPKVTSPTLTLCQRPTLPMPWSGRVNSHPTQGVSSKKTRKGRTMMTSIAFPYVNRSNLFLTTVLKRHKKRSKQISLLINNSNTIPKKVTTISKLMRTTILSRQRLLSRKSDRRRLSLTSLPTSISSSQKRRCIKMKCNKLRAWKNLRSSRTKASSQSMLT